jgi:hypothetical protein
MTSPRAGPYWPPEGGLTYQTASGDSSIGSTAAGAAGADGEGATDAATGIWPELDVGRVGLGDEAATSRAAVGTDGAEVDAVVGITVEGCERPPAGEGTETGVA